MERSFFKYIFVLVVIVLISYTGYKMLKDKHVEENNTLDQTSTVSTIQKDLRLAIAELDTLNPIESKNRNVQEISKIIFEPLVTLDEHFKKEYCLAKEIAKQNETTYLIKIRQGVLWHDGTQFTADDVKYTVDLIKGGSVSSIYNDNLKSLIELKVIDDATIKMTLSEEVPFFEYYLTFPIIKNVQSETGENITVGTGLFKVAGSNANVTKLVKNESYWDTNKKPMVDEIELTNYQTMGEVYNSFKSGEIDIVTVTSNNIEEYIGTIGYNRVDYKSRDYDFLAFNTESEILSNVEVRKALSLCIDKDNLVATSLGTGYAVSNFSLDMGNWLYTRELNPKPDTEQAKQILEAEGWVYKNNSWQKKINDRMQKLTFSITVNENNAERMKVAQNIVNQLGNFGIPVSIVNQRNERYYETLNNRTFDCILTGIETGFTPNLETFFGDGNIANYNNEEIKGILNKVKNTDDETELHNNYSRIYDIYVEEVPYIGLYRNTDTIICNQGLVGNITAYSFNIYHNIEKWYRQ